MAELPNGSRFHYTSKVMFNNKRAWGRWVPPAFIYDPNTSWRNYTVPPGFEGRPDRISQDLYDTSIYWWIIVAMNSPRDTMNWPMSGDIIKTPFLQDIIAVL